MSIIHRIEVVNWSVHTRALLHAFKDRKIHVQRVLTSFNLLFSTMFELCPWSNVLLFNLNVHDTN